MLTLPYDITCGYYDCSEFGELKVSPKRRAVKYEIEFFLEDGLSTYADGNAYTIKKHHIQIATPGQVRYSHLPFKTMYLKFLTEGALAERLTKAPAYFSSSHPEKMIELLNEIILLNESKNNELLLQSRILSFLNLVLSDATIPKLQSGENYEIITKAKRYIEDNYHRGISLQDIACAVNLSPIYFHNIFTAVTGVSPHNYLIRCRITEAKKQLWNTNIPLGVVEKNSGFGCQQYFSRIFKKETGTTPGKYRKEFQQNYLQE